MGHNPKRKCTFNDEYEKIDGVKRSKRKGDGYFFWTYCNEDYNLESMGKTAITQHHKKTKHKDAVRRKQQNQTIQQFVPNKNMPSSLYIKTTAADGCWAYHVVKHHHSFASTNCVSSDGLFREMFSDSEIAKKYGSAHTKTAAIIKGC